MKNIVFVMLTWIIIAASMIFGLYIAWGNKDASKNTGFLLSSGKGTITSIGHLVIGFVIGILLYPAKYSWEDPDKPYTMNWKIWTRQSMGVAAYSAFTIRNFIKHPRNLKKHMKQCDLDLKEYSFFASSFARQQAQLLLGGGLGVLFSYNVIANRKTPISWGTKPTRIIMAITGFTVLQLVLQLVMTRTENYKSLSETLRSCVKQNKKGPPSPVTPVSPEETSTL
jgi:hypothetical protein